MTIVNTKNSDNQTVKEGKVQNSEVIKPGTSYLWLRKQALEGR
jgi:hypothetical protein